MNRTRPFLRVVAVAAPVAALAALAVGVLRADTGGAAPSEALVARDVCDAQELKARIAAGESIEVDFGKFDTPWPTLEACRSHAAAEDPDTDGPLQPIQFSHKHHAGLYQIDCQYCHSGTDRSPSAGVPSVELCMGCHTQFPASYDELEGIRTLKSHWERQEPIEWIQIYRLPEHVQFRHNRHVQAGVDCQRCHGAIEEMDKVYLTPDTIWWPWLLPSSKPEMGWCIDCHRAEGASQDCYTCHY